MNKFRHLFAVLLLARGASESIAQKVDSQSCIREHGIIL